MIKCICKNCGKEHEKQPNQVNKLKNTFCSKSCSAIYNNSLRTKLKYCLHCNTQLVNKHPKAKYCSHKCQFDYQRQKTIEKGTASPRTIKIHLQKTNNKCSICGLTNSWNDKPLTLVLDHIDGNSDNNSIDNLRLVCPNCDSQLPTFKSRNKGNGRHYRRERYANNQSY